MRILQNPIYIITNELDNLKNLVYLDISSCRLIDFNIARDIPLRFLILSHNNFDKFPILICELSTLIKLDLSDTKLKDIPTEINSSANLSKLRLHFNNIEFLDISLLPPLIKLIINNNMLTDLILSIRLRILSIAYNKFLNFKFLSKAHLLYLMDKQQI